MHQSLASNQLPLTAATVAAGASVTVGRYTPGEVQGRARQIAGLAEDAVLILLAIAAVPIAILLVGLPVALVVRSLMALAARL